MPRNVRFSLKVAQNSRLPYPKVAHYSQNFTVRGTYQTLPGFQVCRVCLGVQERVQTAGRDSGLGF